jgi:hypothetical protein
VCKYIKCIHLPGETIHGRNVNAGIPQRQLVFLEKFTEHQMLKQNPTRGVTVVLDGSFWYASGGGKI